MRLLFCFQSDNLLCWQSSDPFNLVSAAAVAATDTADADADDAAADEVAAVAYLKEKNG